MTTLQKTGPHRATPSWRLVIDPALSEIALTSLSCLNRPVRIRMLGGVGAGEGDFPGYPIGPLIAPNIHLIFATGAYAAQRKSNQLNQLFCCGERQPENRA